MSIISLRAFYGGLALATNGDRALTESDLDAFSQNQILFYDPSQCAEANGPSTICGSNAEEKYWTALRRYFDEIHTAGIMANAAHEGGFSPIGVEACSSLWPYNFDTHEWSNGWVSWEYYYNNNQSQGGGWTGTGSLGTTSDRSEYLHYVNEKAPDLLKYYQYPDEYAPFIGMGSCHLRDPSEKTAGDGTLKLIGEANFDRLVQLDVDFFYENHYLKASPPDKELFDRATTASDAGGIWAHKFERCAACGYNQGWAEVYKRSSEAGKYYDEYKSFVCKNDSGEIKGTGDFSSIMKAKNADKSYFNHSGDVPSAHWSDLDKESLKTALETYGDLAYQLGKTIGAPWIAIFVQMRYEDAYSECGKNNFWGNGCDSNHNCIGCATIQGETLGEGFTQYGKTLTEFRLNGKDLWYAPVLGISDPKEYLEKLGPRWIYAKVDGPGYSLINAMKNSIDIVLDYIKTPEGKAIVESFHNWEGVNYEGGESSSSSSTPSSFDIPSSSKKVTGDMITYIGDSLSALGTEKMFNEFFSGADYGESWNNELSYIQSSKFIDSYGGGPSGFQILEKIIDEDKLRPYLVFALGTNGEWKEEYIDRLMDLVGSKTTVVILTSKTIPPHQNANGGYDDSNEILKEAAKKHKNIIVGDWAAVVKDQEFNRSDGLHYTYPDGYRAFFQFIYDTLNDNDCVSYDEEYPYYSQSDSRWGSILYGNCSMASCACGAASMAMLATVAAGKDIFPNDIVNLTINSGTYYMTRGSGMANLDKIVGDKYGFEVETVPVNENNKQEVVSKMKEYLNNGYMLHFSGAGSAPFSDVGHYIGVFSIEGDNVLVADSSLRGNKEYNITDLVNAGYHGDAFSAIKKEGTNKNKCKNDECEKNGASKSINKDGFKDVKTADDKIMAPYRDLYKHPELWGQYHLVSNMGPDNCVSFTYYFITKYTSIDFRGEALGDGGAVAKNFYEAYKDDYPGLEISDKPSAYAVASCGDTFYNPVIDNFTHTFIILGTDEAKNKMIIGEAGYRKTVNFSTAKEHSLTGAGDIYNGNGGVPCTFVNINKYIKDL